MPGTVIADGNFHSELVPAIGDARSVECPRCKAAAGEMCHGDRDGMRFVCVPNHIERARAARWAEMLRL